MRVKLKAIQQYGQSLSADQWSALNALDGCRQGQYGEVDWHCQRCHHQQSTSTSCDHRSCNQCQNTSTQQWLQRQELKLLPVSYFMVTFTLPMGFRRFRDYGFLHGNAKHSLRILQQVFRVELPGSDIKKLPAKIACPKCQSIMRPVAFRPKSRSPG